MKTREILSSAPRVSPRSFPKQVETRMRLNHESLEIACQSVMVHLEDDEIEALIAQAEDGKKSEEVSE